MLARGVSGRFSLTREADERPGDHRPRRQPRSIVA